MAGSLGARAAIWKKELKGSSEKSELPEGAWGS